MQANQNPQNQQQWITRASSCNKQTVNIGPEAPFTRRENADISTRFGLSFTRKRSFCHRKRSFLKNSGQSGDFWKRRLCVVVSTGRNWVLGSEASHYAPGNAWRHMSALCLQFVCLLQEDARVIRCCWFWGFWLACMALSFSLLEFRFSARARAFDRRLFY